MADNDPVSDNQREHARHRVLKAGKIILDDWTAIDCVVKDISDTGAKLRTEKPADVPDRFRLVIMMDNSIRPVSVARRSESELGINFTGPATRAPARKF